jgi:molybdopterin-guanine dinucleotide biosynthesis protein A
MSLYGLVLAGGASTRMQRDKATLVYHDRPQLQWTYELLAGVCARTFVSVRADQAAETLRARYPQIVDSVAVAGPMAGILSALSAHPDDAWFVLACDLPFVDRATLDHLLSHRNAARVATAYRSARDGLPEPLCAIFEPQARAQIEAFRVTGRDCPRKFLLQSDAHIVDLPNRRALDNVNTPEERTAAARMLPPSPHVSGERAGVRGRQ